jgi:hypothetical protein
VIPNTLLGIVVFAAAVGPGFLYVRIAELWRPYRERTPLREAAELVIVGSIASTAGVFVALILGDATGGLDTNKLAANVGE